MIDAANDAVQVFASDGTYLRSILGSSINPGARTFAFGGDDDIAVDNSGGANAGNVYVNSENGSFGGAGTFAFDRTGAFLWQAGGFSDECGIGVDPSGGLWGADFGGGIQPLSTANGTVTGPAVVVTGDTCHFGFDGSSNFILNHWDGAIEKFDPSGRSLVRYIPGLIYVDVAADESNGFVYTVQVGNGIYFWDSAGNLQAGSPFAPNATAVTVDAVGRRLFASTSSGVEIYTLPVQHTLSVTVGGSGTGSVSADSGLIRGCTSSGGTCSDRYDDGTTVTLQATPDATSTFAGWSVEGDPSACTDPTAACRVTVTADTRVTATFDPIPPRTLRVDFAGSGGGSVVMRSTDPDVVCSATCSHDFLQGTFVAMTATPAAHSTFVGWSGGGCSGTAPCQLTLDADAEVTATFAQDLPSVSGEAASGTSTTSTTLGGSVNPNGAATTCEFEYGTSTSYGTRVPCSANPGSGASPVAVSAALASLTPATTYHFRLDATNAGGTVSGGDHTFTTGTVTQPPRTCATDATLCVVTVGLASRTALVKSGKAPVKLVCSGDRGGTCTGTLRLTIKVKVKTGRKSRTKTVTVGSARYSIGEGVTKTVTVKLSSTAKRLLAKHRSLAVTATAPRLSRRLTLKMPKPRPKRHK